jgi:hypothetical protein
LLLVVDGNSSFVTAAVQFRILNSWLGPLFFTPDGSISTD